MKNLKFVLVFIVCLFVSASLFAKEKSCQSEVETFLSGVIAGKINEAYDVFIENSLLKQKQQEMDLLKKQTIVGVTIYGKMLGYEFIKQETFGNSIMKLVYMLKCEQHPIIWEFYFYKPQSEWLLVNILFNDQIKLLSN